MTAPTPHPDRAEQTEVVHACPPGTKAVTPCCGRSPFELLRSDRLTVDPGLVTCTGRAEQAQPGGYVPPAVGAPTWPRPWRPEDGDTRCQECGRLNPVWSTDAETWNGVMGSEAGILCPTCFALKANDGAEIWRLTLADRGAEDELRADRDRLRDVVAAARVDLLAGRVDEALAALRAAGGQP